jgi:hypothetical protein
MENAGANYMIPLALVICSVITMIMGSIYSIKLNRKDYGIMLANGMTHIDINVISALTVEIKIIISFVIASAYVYVNANTIDENGLAMFSILLPVFVLFLLIISLIVIGFNVAIVNKDNTMNKIEGN